MPQEQLSTLRTPHPRPPRVLRHGQFFGDARCERHTHSFVFANMVATWSAEELPRHSHENAFFCYIVRGVYLSAASENPCGPCTAIFNPPGTIHRDRFRTRVGHFFTVSVSPDISRRMRNASPVPKILREPRVFRILREAFLELRHPDDASDLVLEGLGLELAGRVEQSPLYIDAHTPRWLQRSRELIRENCTSSPTMGAIAHSAGVHPVHLARSFRQYFHCSPGEYLRACRIERACRLLAGSRLPLVEIAQQLGFSDQSRLTHAFKRAMGFTPGDYRRSLLG